MSKIEMATEEDKAHGIDYWARLFKAKTCEKIKLLVKNDESMQEAANSIYMANADELVRQKCYAREKVERHERTMLRSIKILEEKNSELKDENSELKEKNSELKDENSELKTNTVIKTAA